MSANGGVCPGGGVCLQPRGGEVVYTPCGQTDTCENMAFPQLLLPTVIKGGQGIVGQEIFQGYETLEIDLNLHSFKT